MKKFAACLVLFGVACGPTCETEMLQSVSSPDGRHVATAFIRNCHATSPYVTSVSIRRSTDEFDADDDDYVFAAKGRGPVHATWASNDTLVLQAGDGEAYRKTDRWRDVVVRYEPLPTGRP